MILYSYVKKLEHNQNTLLHNRGPNKSHMRLNTTWQKEIYTNPDLMGKVIAIRDEKIIFVGETYQEVIEHVSKESPYSVFKVPRNIFQIRILSFKIKSVFNSKKSWRHNPFFPSLKN